MGKGIRFLEDTKKGRLLVGFTTDDLIDYPNFHMSFKGFPSY